MKSNIEPIKILRKRGRKPKNKISEVVSTNEEIINSDKEVIIAYLPIKINDLEIDINSDKEDNDNVFIKSETTFFENKIKEKNDIINSSVESEINVNNKYLNKINIYNIEFNQNTKCWWCKNIFNTPKVVLPEEFNNDTFYCIGNFCSYNCAKAYNIDLNDLLLWKRESLLNLLYYLTYGYYKQIIHAPSWLILKEFGGFIDIKEYRKNFETNNSEYLVLHPPIISRQMQIEESYKKSQPHFSAISKIDKLIYDSENLMLKRNKPVETSQFNLETTMGLKRKIIKI